MAKKHHQTKMGNRRPRYQKKRKNIKLPSLGSSYISVYAFFAIFLVFIVALITALINSWTEINQQKVIDDAYQVITENVSDGWHAYNYESHSNALSYVETAIEASLDFDPDMNGVNEIFAEWVSEAYSLLALIQLDNSNESLLAKESATMAIYWHPTNYYAFYLRCVAYGDLGDINAAKADCAHVIDNAKEVNRGYALDYLLELQASSSD